MVLLKGSQNQLLGCHNCLNVQNETISSEMHLNDRHICFLDVMVSKKDKIYI